MKKKSANWYVKRRLKAPKEFFEWCYSQVSTFEWENKKQKITSGRKDCEVIKKKLSKRSVLDFFHKDYFFLIVLCDEKRIEIQTYNFESKFVKGIQNINVILYNMEVFENDQHIETRKEYWLGGKEYTFGLNSTNLFGNPYGDVKRYDNQIDDKLFTISELKYLKVENKISFMDIKSFYKFRREIEYLQKINASQMAEELMYHPGDFDLRTFGMKWLAKHKHVIKNTDKKFKEVIFADKIIARGGKVVPGSSDYIPHYKINRIPQSVGMIKFQNWAIKKKLFFQDYDDYLRLLEKCHVPIDENRACPKDFTRAHQEAVNLFNAMEKELELEEQKKRDEEMRKKFEEILRSCKKLERVVGDYKFILPKQASDLVKEGSILHHCVSSYVERYTKGETTIVFIRKKENENVPLYTMEYRGKEIIQVRAKYNQDPPKEVMEIVNVWKKEVEKVRGRA